MWLIDTHGASLNDRYDFCWALSWSVLEKKLEVMDVAIKSIGDFQKHISKAYFKSICYKMIKKNSLLNKDIWVIFSTWTLWLQYWETFKLLEKVSTLNFWVFNVSLEKQET